MYLMAAGKMGSEAAFVKTVSSLPKRVVRRVVRVGGDKGAYVYARLSARMLIWAGGWPMLSCSLRSKIRIPMGRWQR